MITDNAGNMLYRQGNAIKLKLSSEPHPRKIGRIEEDKKILIIQRDSTKHLFDKINGYGFNYQLLCTATKFNKVLLEIIDKKERYLIPIDTILLDGQFLNFKQQGFEIQIFIPLTIINDFKL